MPILNIFATLHYQPLPNMEISGKLFYQIFFNNVPATHRQGVKTFN